VKPEHEYERRVNRVIDHIYEHLADDLSLASLARVAAFSPFHFHRMFKAITGETLFGFIHRVRIERAAAALAARTDESVLAIALDHGFSSAAAFARAFRAHFGMSATEWRAGGADRWRARHRSERNPGQQLRKGGKAAARRGRHAHQGVRQEGRMSVQVRESPAYHVAYMRYVGPFGAHGIPELWGRFWKWVATRGVDGDITLGVAHDDPAITPPDKCRYDACIVVPRDFTPDRWVNVSDIPGGKYAVSEFVGAAHEIQEAWDAVYRGWLPMSGWQPDDRPCYELYRGNPTVDVRKRVFRCDLCVPVRPL
jgi:AraC family transcriptional regulator